MPKFTRSTVSLSEAPVPREEADSARVLLTAIESAFAQAQHFASAMQRHLREANHSAAKLAATQRQLAGLLANLRSTPSAPAPAEPRDPLSEPPADPAGAADVQPADASAAEEIRRLKRQLAYQEFLLHVAHDDMSRAESLHTEATQIVRGALGPDLLAAAAFQQAPAECDGTAECEHPSDSAVTPSARPFAAPTAELAPREELLVVDDGILGPKVAGALAGNAYRAVVVRPTLDVPALLSERQIVGAAINLATPNAWGAVRRLRFSPAEPPVPLVAYALPHDASRGFWLGVIDFVTASAEESVLIEALTRLVPGIKRVMAMSSDLDVMEHVRKELNNRRISTAVVLDHRQVLNMLSVVRPEAALVHLSPRCMDVFRAIAALRSQRQWRDVPILFFLDEEAQPRDIAFLTAGVRMLAVRGDLDCEELLTAVTAHLAACNDFGNRAQA